jgi:integrase
MARKDELGRDTEGRYRRYLGWKWGNGRPIQHLFRLGRDEAKAKAANYRLEQLWDAVVARWRRWKAEGTTDEPSPVWDDTTLAIGGAIAKGQAVCTLHPPEGLGAAGAAMWLTVLQTQFPMIGLKLPDKVREEGVAGLKDNVARWDFYKRLDEAALNALGETAGQAVREALDAYSAYLKEKYRDKDRPLQLSVRLLRQHVEDFALNKLDADRIDTWSAYWCRRPASKDTKKEAGTPLAYTTCRNALIVLRHFLRWLSRSPAFDWTLPGGYVFSRCKIAKVATDRAKKHRRRHWTPDELRIIWTYAKPWDRALILLALNCGFSKAEIATLQPCEIIKGKSHTFIKRDRRKTEVYGEWVLWPETLEALDYLRQFQKPDSVYVVLNTAGGALNTKTPTGNENQVIKNHWDNLMKRVRADHPDFHVLPFKHLRKTGGNLIRHMKVKGAVELAVMYLAHGERMDGGDSQLSAYTDRPWRKLHGALMRLRRSLLPVLTSVERPWAYTMNTISPVRRARVLELRAGGMTLKAIASEVGLHEMTVGKICRRGAVSTPTVPPESN